MARSRSGDGERGEIGIGIMLAVVATFVVAVAIVHLFMFLYGQAVVRSALDEAVRTGSRVDGGPALCLQTATEVRDDLLGGQLGDGVTFRCVARPGPGRYPAGRLGGGQVPQPHARRANADPEPLGDGDPGGPGIAMSLERVKGVVRSERGEASALEMMLVIGFLLLPTLVGLAQIPRWIDARSTGELAAQEAARQVALSTDFEAGVAAADAVARQIVVNHGWDEEAYRGVRVTGRWLPVAR